MDYSALIGVVIGSVSSIGATTVSHWLSMKKEENQWTRQQNAEKEKLEFQFKMAKKEKASELYQQSIYFLRLCAAKDTKLEPKGDELSNVFNWVTKLVFHLAEAKVPSGEKVKTTLDQLTSFSDANFYCEPLIRDIYECYQQDQTFKD